MLKDGEDGRRCEGEREGVQIEPVLNGQVVVCFSSWKLEFSSVISFLAIVIFSSVPSPTISSTAVPWCRRPLTNLPSPVLHTRLDVRGRFVLGSHRRRDLRGGGSGGSFCQ